MGGYDDKDKGYKLSNIYTEKDIINTKKETIENIFEEIEKLDMINIVYPNGSITHLNDCNDIHELKKKLLFKTLKTNEVDKITYEKPSEMLE